MALSLQTSDCCDDLVDIFVGIKGRQKDVVQVCHLISFSPAPGTFQHSSFLAGGLVTSAGLISVKDGLIHTLSPLSGHYRYVDRLVCVANLLV